MSQDGCIVAIKIFKIRCKPARRIMYEGQNALGMSKFLRTANLIKVR